LTETSTLSLHDALPICSQGESPKRPPAGNERDDHLGKRAKLAEQLHVLAVGGTPHQELITEFGHKRWRLGAQNLGHVVRGHGARSEEHTSELQSPDHLV